MATITGDPKRRRILDGATKVFLSYGFQRTTMDDIARAADMSRPALYLLFRNKVEIYQAIAEGRFDDSLATAGRILAGDEPIEQRLNEMLERSVFAMVAEFMQSPHGHEILDMKNELACDAIRGWKQQMTGLVAEALDRTATENGVDLAARGAAAEVRAELFWDAIEGMKARLRTVEDLRATSRSLVRIVTSGVTA